MRSRYAAYALGLADYILRTTHPEGPHFEDDRDRWLAEVKRFSASAAFVGLEIVEASEANEAGFVHFVARLQAGDKIVEMAERSRFEKIAGLWRYHSGERR
jgi:SEC-C motif-containing protein